MSNGPEPWVRQILRCPIGLHELVDATDDAGHPVLECAEDCGGPDRRLRFPVRSGIPVLLADEATATSVRS